MGPIDREVELIRESILDVHRTLYKVDRHMEGIVQVLDKSLGEFESAVRGVEGDVKNVHNQVLAVTDQLPDQTVYLAIILCVNVLIWILAVFLLYQIAVAIFLRKECSLRYQKKPSYRRVFAKDVSGDSVVLRRHSDDVENPSFLSLNSSLDEERKTLLAVYREPLR